MTAVTRVSCRKHDPAQGTLEVEPAVDGVVPA